MPKAMTLAISASRKFSEQTTEGLKKAISDLTSQLGSDKIKGFVVDLRNNPGGLLDQAISVSDAFLDEGEIVSTRGRNAEETQRFNARPGDLTKGKSVIVLINGGSASASEIVAGALQDQRRATLVSVAMSFLKRQTVEVRHSVFHYSKAIGLDRYIVGDGQIELGSRCRPSHIGFAQERAFVFCTKRTTHGSINTRKLRLFKRPEGIYAPALRYSASSVTAKALIFPSATAQRRPAGMPTAHWALAGIVILQFLRVS
jgi:Peptidase family S41